MKLNTLFAMFVVCATLITNVASSLDKSIVVYYSFNDGTATDESGNGNDGNITKTKVVEGVAGHGKALEFDGKSWVELKANKTLDIAEITMAAWIYKDEVFLANNGENIISKKLVLKLVQERSILRRRTHMSAQNTVTLYPTMATANT